MKFFVLLVVGTSIWVAIDASRLGVRSGLLGGGLADMGAAGWTAACLLLWIVGFPAYLITRPRYLALAGRSPWSSPGTPGGAEGSFHPPGSAPPWQAPGVGPARQTSKAASSRQAPVLAQPSLASKIDQLTDLAKLRDSGAVTPAEYEQLKAGVLAQNND